MERVDSLLFRSPSCGRCVVWCISRCFGKKIDPLDRRDRFLVSLKRVTPQKARHLLKTHKGPLYASHYHQMMKHFSSSKDITGLIQEMKDRDINIDTKAYTMLVRAHCKQGNIKEAIDVKNQMLKESVRVNQVTYATIMQGVNENQLSMDICEELLYEMKQRGLSRNNTVYCTLLSGYADKKDKSRLKNLLEEIKADGIEPNSYTKRAIIYSLIQINDLPAAHKYLQDIVAANGVENSILHNTLISGYLKANQFVKAIEVFDQLKQLKTVQPTAVTYTTIINALERSGDIAGVEVLLSEMKQTGTNPCERIYENIIHSSATRRDFVRARKFLHQMRLHHLIPSSNIYSLLIDAAVENTEPFLARTFLQEMQQSSLHTLIPIASYMKVCKAFSDRDTIHYAHELVQEAITKQYTPPDVLRLYNILLASTNRLFMDTNETMRVYEELCNNCTPDVYSMSTMMSFYAKRGNIKEAQKLFDRINSLEGLEANLVVYSALINAYVKGGDFVGAAEKEREMMASGFIPNEIVMITILTGMIKETTDSQMVFEKLAWYKQKKISISPKVTSLVADGFIQIKSMRECIEFLKFCHDQHLVVPKVAFFKILAKLLHADDFDSAVPLCVLFPTYYKNLMKHHGGTNFMTKFGQSSHPVSKEQFEHLQTLVLLLHSENKL